MRFNLTKILSFNAGYVDTASFLALHGLFAAHVTGNFVTLGAALVNDSPTGTFAKLFALPMFCLMVLLTRLIDLRFVQAHKSSYKFLLISKIILFSLAAVLSVFYLPFPQTDTWPSFIVGMLLVSAMAIQNAMHRLHWVKESPTTVMTGQPPSSCLMLQICSANPMQRKKHRLLPVFKILYRPCSVLHWVVPLLHWSITLLYCGSLLFRPC